ncbi:hypothetical protein [Bradyrhizobium sp.]|uniref:hypothetical protein n=1 Tax=Bradyrhizobium sp. TaxID=376 RepID=UPI004037A150
MLGEVSLGAIGAGVGVAALGVAVLPAIDILVGTRRDVASAAEGIVIGRGVDHSRLAAFEAAGEQRGDEQQSWKQSHFCAVRFNSSLPGLTRQSIKKKASFVE